MSQRASVSFVGAGLGDPELITVEGLRPASRRSIGTQGHARAGDGRSPSQGRA
jgi:hypothetical protein